MRVLVAMSGGVDSSVAAAELVVAGHEVVGATMKLWGGPSDSGCCSVADVDDARRVAQQLDIPYHVFNFTEEFEKNVIEPYVADHAKGVTPNPCIECNRQVKFDRFIERADQLGFDAIATGHHARVEEHEGVWRLRRGADAEKDQSYVVHMLGQLQLSKTVFPVGHMEKSDVRRRAAELGLRTADKPDSQDVCFISSVKGGRGMFLGERIPLRSGTFIDNDTGKVLGETDAIELVNVGQRKGLVQGTDGKRRYALHVDVQSQQVTLGSAADLIDNDLGIDQMSWTDQPLDAGVDVIVQASAHGRALAATFTGDGVRFFEGQRRVAPGQSVVLYDGDYVVGGGKARSRAAVRSAS